MEMNNNNAEIMMTPPATPTKPFQHQFEQSMVSLFTLYFELYI